MDMLDYNSQDTPLAARYRPWGALRGVRQAGSKAPLAGYSRPFPRSAAEHPGEGRGGQGRDTCEEQPPAGRGRVQLALAPHRSQTHLFPNLISSPTRVPADFFRASCGVQAQILAFLNCLWTLV